MKKIRILTPALLLALLALLCAASAGMAAVDVQELIKARTSKCWVEGEVVGNMVWGARGSIEFVYLDKKLSDEMLRARTRFNDAKIPVLPFENWLEEGQLYFGKPEAKGKAVFLAYVTTNKPWDFDFTQVFVGGHRLEKQDVLSPSWSNPFGELPSELEEWFAFAVPKSELKPGETVKIGYGEYAAEWKVPK